MFKNPIILTLIACHIFLISCNDRKVFKFNEKLIDRIANENLEIPSQYNSVILFCKCGDNEIALTYMQELRGVYKNRYNKMMFSQFVEDALNQKLDISYKDKIKCFSLDSKVKEKYEKNSFENFVNLYCDKFDGVFRIKKNIKESQFNSILYYLFLHNYLTIFNDYEGYYYSQKASDFSKE